MNEVLSYDVIRKKLIGDDPTWKKISIKEQKNIANTYLRFKLKAIREQTALLQKSQIQYAQAIRVFQSEIKDFIWKPDKHD